MVILSWSNSHSQWCKILRVYNKHNSIFSLHVNAASNPSSTFLNKTSRVFALSEMYIGVSCSCWGLTKLLPIVGLKNGAKSKRFAPAMSICGGSNSGNNNKCISVTTIISGSTERSWIGDNGHSTSSTNTCSFGSRVIGSGGSISNVDNYQVVETEPTEPTMVAATFVCSPRPSTTGSGCSIDKHLMYFIAITLRRFSSNSNSSKCNCAYRNYYVGDLFGPQPMEKPMRRLKR